MLLPKHTPKNTHNSHETGPIGSTTKCQWFTIFARWRRIKVKVNGMCALCHWQWPPNGINSNKKKQENEKVKGGIKGENILLDLISQRGIAPTLIQHKEKTRKMIKMHLAWYWFQRKQRKNIHRVYRQQWSLETPTLRIPFRIESIGSDWTTKNVNYNRWPWKHTSWFYGFQRSKGKVLTCKYNAVNWRMQRTAWMSKPIQH